MPVFLTTTQAGNLLKCSRIRITQLIAEGRLKAVKFGTQWMIDEREAKKFKPMKRGRPRNS